jgi:hypothetical protein
MTRPVCLASVEPDEAGRLCGSLVCPVPARSNTQIERIHEYLTDLSSRWRIDASLTVNKHALNKTTGQ